MAAIETAARGDGSPVVPGRSCGDCTLCCKTLGIAELGKPQGQWCPHCAIGRGCKIYADRPPSCREFNCLYLTEASLGEGWKPSRSKIVLVAESDSNRLTAHVDAQRPDAWQKEPFYAQLKEWARKTNPAEGQVVVCIGRRTFVILSDRDVDLGIVSDDEAIVSRQVQTPFGPRAEAVKVRKDVPGAE